ncbi:MAG TPA: hypothetical protein VHC18_21980 [Amycolatopsis sp.]|nr:hypothetical protein [Amycolatopsis sp.]
MLDRGRHFGPRAGGCFMEVASVLAGERWSDHPRCTHPLLAEAVRLINDQVGDESRQRLVRLIPDVIGANRRHPVITAELVRVLARHALAASPGDEALHWADDRARRRIARWESGGWWRHRWLRASDYWFRTHERVRVPALLRAMLDCDDEAFVAVVTDTIATYHRTVRRLDAGQPACTPRCEEGTADIVDAAPEPVRQRADR